MCSLSLCRTKKSGDNAYIKINNTYKRLMKGEINKEQAIRIIGEKSRNTVELWLKEFPTD